MPLLVPVRLFHQKQMNQENMFPDTDELVVLKTEIGDRFHKITALQMLFHLGSQTSSNIVTSSFWQHSPVCFLGSQPGSSLSNLLA